MLKVNINFNKSYIMAAELSKEEFLVPPIEKLDEDSLICILSKLPVADLVRVERVSKSWQEIAKKSWSGFKKLDLRPSKLGLRICTYKRMDHHVVEQILLRCGSSTGIIVKKSPNSGKNS